MSGSKPKEENLILPIHSALSDGNYQLARQYIESGESVDLKDESGFTPLILCSVIEHQTWARGLATLLLEHGAQISIADLQAYNAFHHACFGQRCTLVTLYLSSMDFDLDSKTNEGYTALHIAALVGNQTILSAIAEKMLHYKLNLDPVSIKGFTPMQLAWRSNHLDCGDSLVRLGASLETPVPGSRCLTAANMRSSAAARLNEAQLLSKDRHGRKQVKAVKMVNKTAPLKTQRPTTLSAKSSSMLQRNKTEANMFRTNNQQVPSTIIPQTSLRRSKISNGWQEELYALWSHYEQQCTTSFRKAAKFQTTSSQADSDDVFEGESSMPLPRRGTKLNLKSRTGFVTSGETSRRTSTASQGRRNGAPSLSRSQSRPSFSLPPPKQN